MPRITLERSLIPKARNEPTPVETELLMLVQQLIRSGCSINDLSTKHLAQQLGTTTDSIMTAKASLRTKRFMEFEYTRDEQDQPGLVVRVSA